MLFIDLVNIISREFFSGKEVYYNILQLFGIAGLGAMVRPLGAFIFGHFGDRYGRKASLPVAILLVSIPSSLVAFIPSYSQIGITSTILLLIIHVTQGIALGAEQGGSSVYLIEHLSHRKKNLGMFFGIIGFGRSIGILLAAIIVIICKKTTDFNSWGWRLPFILSAFLGLISAYNVYTLGETPAYKANLAQKKNSLPIIELLKHHRRALVLAILISVPVNVIVGFTIFLRTLAKEIVSMEVYVTTYISEIVSIITSILMPIFSIILGILADKVGRERTAIIFIIITIIMCCPVLSLAYYYKSYLVIMLSIMFFSIIERGVNPIGIVTSELFPTSVRFSGVSLSRNISFALHGGFTSMICIWLTIRFPQIDFAAGFYIILCLLISLVAILQIKPEDKKFGW